MDFGDHNLVISASTTKSLGGIHPKKKGLVKTIAT
jgi:hypothetical protein